MNILQFMALIEGYYGKYERPAQKDIVRQYLILKYGDESKELDVLYKRTLLEYSGKFRYAPDIAILEDIRRQVNAETDGWRIDGVKLLSPGDRRTPQEMAVGLQEVQEVLEKLATAKRLREKGK